MTFSASAPERAPLVRVHGVRKSYDKGGATPLVVLDDVDRKLVGMLRVLR